MKQPSGKFVIRMSSALHGRLREEATRTGQSLNQLCVAKLQPHPSFPAGRGAAVTQTDSISSDFLEKIASRWHGDLVGLVLFGSAARGDATENSDVDLLVVMKPEVVIARALYRLWEEFCREYPGEQDHSRISPHFVRLPERVRRAGGLWCEAALDGIVLWERERQVSRFLASVRNAMGHGKIRRRMLHGSPYWIKEFEESDA
jgi:hypothetical protein